MDALENLLEEPSSKSITLKTSEKQFSTINCVGRIVGLHEL